MMKSIVEARHRCWRFTTGLNRICLSFGTASIRIRTKKEDYQTDCLALWGSFYFYRGDLYEATKEMDKATDDLF